MEKRISTNQASLLLVIFTLALKLSVLPVIMSDYAGKSSYITVLIALVFDFIGTLIIISVITKIPNKSFFELIKDNLGKIPAIVVEIILMIYFFTQSTIALIELYDYYVSTLFEELNPTFALITLGFLFLYMLTKDFRTLGRLLEMCFWALSIGITFTLIFPVSDMEITNLFPLFEDGLYPVWHALIKTTFAFGDYMILFVLMGKIQFHEKSKKKMLFYMLSILSFIFNFYVIFEGAFGSTTINQNLALGELPLHNSYPTTIGRLEWLTIIVWTSILLIYAIVVGRCCCDSFNKVFKSPDNKVAPIVITIALIVTQPLTDQRFSFIIKIVTSNAWAIGSGAIQLGCIALLLIGYLLEKRKSKNKPIPSSNTTLAKSTSSSGG